MAESKRAFWQQQLDDWKASGQTQVSFCVDRNLNKNTFAYWRKRIADQPEPASMGFLPVQIQHSEHKNSTIELIVKDDFKIQISDDFSESTLKRLVRFLQVL